MRSSNSPRGAAFIACGRFEELDGPQAYAALERLSARLRAVTGTPHDTPDFAESFVRRRGGYGVAYRIALQEKSGR